MIHLRIVAPEDVAHHALELLCASPAVINVVHLHGASHKPKGDVLLCDITREEASVIISDLKELDIPKVGSIAVEHVDTAISDAAVAAEKAAPGLPSDAVVWEEVQQRTSEDTELSFSFVAFMVIAMQIAAVGILYDQPILIVGAMVVGPEFGPLAGLSVALVQRQRALARRSLRALAVGFPTGVLLTLATVMIFKGSGLGPETYTASNHRLTGFISHPDFFSFFVAFVAGVGRHDLPDQRQIRRADRRAGLGHHDPGGVQHRGCGDLRRLVRGSRCHHTTRRQPRLDRAGRSDHAVRAAALLRRAAAQASV